MSDLKHQFEEFVANAKEYFETRKQLALLIAGKHAATGLSKTLISSSILLFSLFFLIFGNITLGFFFGDLLGSYTKGFLVVTLIYFFLAVVILLFFKKLSNSIANYFVKSFFKEENKNENTN